MGLFTSIGGIFMAWNGSVNGDWSNVDFSKPPWVAGIAELTHDEVVFVQDTIENDVRPTYQPQIGDPTEPSDFWLQSQYNIYTQWEKPINGDTYFCIKGYDRSVNTNGINANGIIQPEPPVDETTPPQEV
jgi:hypothetical protein